MMEFVDYRVLSMRKMRVNWRVGLRLMVLLILGNVERMRSCRSWRMRAMVSCGELLEIFCLCRIPLRRIHCYLLLLLLTLNMVLMLLPVEVL